MPATIEAAEMPSLKYFERSRLRRAQPITAMMAIIVTGTLAPYEHAIPRFGKRTVRVQELERRSNRKKQECQELRCPRRLGPAAGQRVLKFLIGRHKAPPQALCIGPSF
jgi:hypothetical protein